MKNIEQKPIIILDIFFIIIISLFKFVIIDSSGGPGLLSGLVFSLMFVSFMLYAIIVLVTYILKLGHLKQWGKNDYYAILLTLSCLFVFLLVGSSL